MNMLSDRVFNQKNDRIIDIQFNYIFRKVKMENKTAIEDLGSKISLILEKYNELKEENSALKEELASTKASLETERQTVAKLKEEDELKDMELEEIALKIGEIMGLN